MPEYPDITIYVEAMEVRLKGQPIQKILIKSPFLLRTFDPPISQAQGKRILSISRIGKQIIWNLEEDLHLVFHLMIAGRFHWKATGAKAGGKNVLALFEFSTGVLQLTEASTKKRASLHLVKGEEALAQFNRGGLEIFTATREQFRDTLREENHTLKRTLTDPRLFSAIGNSYSDEILHHARMSPMKLSRSLTDDEADRLFASCKTILSKWTETLRDQTADKFPEKVTAFHSGMAVHGKAGQPCPVCGTQVQRIVYAENECNYCPRCQTGGKLLADRSLSRLLKNDWPRTVEEMEAIAAQHRLS